MYLTMDYECSVPTTGSSVVVSLPAFCWKDVKTVSTNRNHYPEVQVWRIDAGITPTWVARQEIRLTAGDFSPDGVLQYNLTSSIPFQNGDFLGVYSYQPPAFSSVSSANQNFAASTAATIPE